MASPLNKNYLPDSTVIYIEEGPHDIFAFFNQHCATYTFCAPGSIDRTGSGFPPVQSNDECSICLGDLFRSTDEVDSDEYRHGNNVVTNSACQHVYHTRCWMEWFGTGTDKTGSCPDCREFWFHTSAEKSANAGISSIVNQLKLNEANFMVHAWDARQIWIHGASVERVLLSVAYHRLVNPKYHPTAIDDRTAIDDPEPSDINIAETEEGREVIARLQSWVWSKNGETVRLWEMITNAVQYVRAAEHLSHPTLGDFSEEVMRLTLGILLVEHGEPVLINRMPRQRRMGRRGGS